MNNLIQILFVGGVGLSVSAIVTWLAYLSLLIFDIDKEQAEIRKDDQHIEYRIDEVESDVDKLLRDFRDGGGKAL